MDKKIDDFRTEVQDDIVLLLLDKGANLNTDNGLPLKPSADEITGWLRSKSIHVWIEPSDNGYTACVESPKSYSCKFFNEYKDAISHAIREGIKDV